MGKGTENLVSSPSAGRRRRIEDRDDGKAGCEWAARVRRPALDIEKGGHVYSACTFKKVGKSFRSPEGTLAGKLCVPRISDKALQ